MHMRLLEIIEITIRILNTDTRHAKSGPMGGCFASITKTARNSVFGGESCFKCFSHIPQKSHETRFLVVKF